MGQYKGSEHFTTFPKREKILTVQGAYDTSYEIEVSCVEPCDFENEADSFVYSFKSYINIGPEYLSWIGYDYDRILYFLEVDQFKWLLSENMILSHNPRNKEEVLKEALETFFEKVRQNTLPVRIVELIQTLFQKKHLDVV